MKCPVCDVWTRTLETRNDASTNEIWRRKECGNLHVFITIEQVSSGDTPRPRDKRLVAFRQGRGAVAREIAQADRSQKRFYED
jgi:transcriptional regulator NrdR family protein